MVARPEMGGLSYEKIIRKGPGNEINRKGRD
jgi:hypothetical protein